MWPLTCVRGRRVKGTIIGYQLPNGSSVQLGATISAEETITAASNVAPTAGDLKTGCVLTLNAATTIKAGDTVMLIKSPWLRAVNSCHLVGKVDSTTPAAPKVTLAGFNTLDTSKYPAGAFSTNTPGVLVKISGFMDFPYITNVAISGGDQQTVTFQPLQVMTAISLNTTKNPLIQTYTLTHDSEDPIRPILEGLDDTQSNCAIKFTNPAAAGGKGEVRLYAAKVSFQKIPSAEVNAVETVTAALSMQSDMYIYRKDKVDGLVTP